MLKIWFPSDSPYRFWPKTSKNMFVERFFHFLQDLSNFWGSFLLGLFPVNNAYAGPTNILNDYKKSWELSGRFGEMTEGRWIWDIAQD